MKLKISIAIIIANFVINCSHSLERLRSSLVLQLVVWRLAAGIHLNEFPLFLLLTQFIQTKRILKLHFFSTIMQKIVNEKCGLERFSLQIVFEIVGLIGAEPEKFELFIRVLINEPVMQIDNILNQIGFFLIPVL